MAGLARVRQNAGSAGGDGVTIDAFAAHAGERIAALSAALRDGSYRPGPLRVAFVDKAGGGSRKLTIPSVRDRVAQSSVAQILTPLLDAEMEDASFGYRPGRGVVDAVKRVDFNEAMEKIILGVERHIMLNPEDRRRVAFHESGHALLGILIPGSDPVRRVTIVPRGQALGVTYQMPLDDRYNYPEDFLRARIIGALGGRAAEEIVFGVVTSGAENDLKQVTDIARQMVTKWGMSHTLGLVAYGGSDDEVFLGRELATQRNYSDETAGKIDEEIKRIIDDCYSQAVSTLRSHTNQLTALAEALLEQESLDEQDILKVVGLANGNAGSAVALEPPLTGGWAASSSLEN